MWLKLNTGLRIRGQLPIRKRSSTARGTTICKTSPVGSIKRSEAFAEVDIPFLKELIENPGTQRGSDIRRFKLLQKCIASSALLHARHREHFVDKDGRRHLIATKEDLSNIKPLFELMVPTTSQPAGKAYLKTFSKIAVTLYEKGNPMDRYQLRASCSLSKKQAEEQLNDLVSVRLLERSSVEGDQKTYYALSDQFLQSVRSALEADEYGSKPRAILETCVDKAIKRIEMRNTLGGGSPVPQSSPEEGWGTFKHALHKAQASPPPLPHTIQ